jgi:hypothetical protein
MIWILNGGEVTTPVMGSTPPVKWAPSDLLARRPPSGRRGAFQCRRLRVTVKVEGLLPDGLRLVAWCLDRRDAGA